MRSTTRRVPSQRSLPARFHRESRARTVPQTRATPPATVTPPPTEPADPIRRFEPGIPAVLAITPVLLAGITMLVSAGGSEEIFLALVQTANIPAVLLNAYIMATPTFVVYGFVVNAFVKHVPWAFGSLRERRATIARWTLPVSVIILFFPLALFEWVLFGISVVVTVVHLLWAPKVARLLGRVLRRPSLARTYDEHEPAEMTGRRPLVLLLIAAVIFFAASSRLWLPPEAVVIRGTPAATGYVLSTTDQETVVYWQNGRGVQRFAREDVVSRELCRNPGVGRTYTLARLFYDPYLIKTARLQPCPR